MTNRVPSSIATISLVARTSSRGSASPSPPSPDRRRFLQILLGGSLAVSATSFVGCSGIEGGVWRPPTNQGSGNNAGVRRGKGGGDRGSSGGRGGGGR